MPTTRRSRTIAAPAQELWELVSDPHHLPRWWPRVTRVEDVRDGAFTQVMRTARGHTVRLDFAVSDCDERELTTTWAQQLEGTPFARLMQSAETELRLRALEGGKATEVTIELRQELPPVGFRWARSYGGPGMFNGLTVRLGAPMMSRAAAATLEEALDGLAQIAG